MGLGLCVLGGFFQILLTSFHNLFVNVKVMNGQSVSRRPQNWPWSHRHVSCNTLLVFNAHSLNVSVQAFYVNRCWSEETLEVREAQDKCHIGATNICTTPALPHDHPSMAALSTFKVLTQRDKSVAPRSKRTGPQRSIIVDTPLRSPPRLHLNNEIQSHSAAPLSLLVPSSEHPSLWRSWQGSLCLLVPQI